MNMGLPSAAKRTAGIARASKYFTVSVYAGRLCAEAFDGAADGDEEVAGELEAVAAAGAADIVFLEGCSVGLGETAGSVGVGEDVSVFRAAREVHDLSVRDCRAGGKLVRYWI